MKNLWCTLPPLLSDSFGFIEVLKGSDGCGIIDDSGGYRLGGKRGRGHSKHGEHPHDGHGPHEKHPPHGEGRHEGHIEKRHGKGDDTRTVVSGIETQDAVAGTRERVLQAFQEARNRFSPQFALFSAGPCGAMIGTDLSEIAEAVCSEYRIPAASVDLTGQKAYDVGISKTIEAMAKLIAQGGEVIPGSVNILGATSQDWSVEDINEIGNWFTALGYQVLSQPGGKVTSAQLALMGKAQLNLVTTVSGLAAARYLQKQFGTPYLAAAPFGEVYRQQLQRAMDGHTRDIRKDGPADVLIIGEQFAANAIRSALQSKGMAAGTDVATFYLLDKSCAHIGDRRLRSEEDAKELLNSAQYRIVIADPLLRPLMQRDCIWIDLPHKALNTYGEATPISLLSDHLDNWLEQHI